MRSPEAGNARSEREEFASDAAFREAFANLSPENTVDRTTTAAIHLQWIDSPFGGLIAGASEDGIVLLEFAERARLLKQIQILQRHFNVPVHLGNSAMLDTLREQLARYFSGALQDFTLPLAYPGSEFQRRVWQLLLEIPYGETRSYQQLAEQLGNPDACRAVGTSNGLNRLAILVPCHRVVNKGGTLGGYAGALWRKQKLLALEQHGRFALTASPP